jgi:quinol monooxygenase YgiN
MAIRLIVTMKAKPGKGDAYAEAYRPSMMATQSEPGCEQYELFQSTLNRDVFVLVERWTDQRSLDDHMVILAKRDNREIHALREGDPVREAYEA